MCDLPAGWRRRSAQRARRSRLQPPSATPNGGRPAAAVAAIAAVGRTLVTMKTAAADGVGALERQRRQQLLITRQVPQCVLLLVAPPAAL